MVLLSDINRLSLGSAWRRRVFGGQVEESVISDIRGELLRGLAAVSGMGMEPSDVVQEIIKSVCDRIGAARGDLFIIGERGGDHFKPIGTGGRRQKAVPSDHPLKREIGAAVSKSGTPYSLTLDNGGGSILYVPVKVHGDVIGIIEIAKEGSGEGFSPEDVSILEETGGLISILVDNARLIEMKNRSRDEIAELMEVAGILNSSLDPRVVQKKAIETVTRLLDCEVASLLLVDEKSNELYFEVALGTKGDQVKEIRLKMGEGIAGWVAQNNRALVIDDVKTDPRHSTRADDHSKFVTRNMICVPMSVKGNVIGVLEAINKLDHGLFSNGDLSILLSLANEVAIAVDNARLYDELRETFYQTAGALAGAIEKRDPYTGDHTRRVMRYSMAIGRRLALSPEERENLMLAAILHDIGKIGVEDSVLRKESRLDDEEYEKIAMHPQIGVDILGHIKKLGGVVPGMKSHHERYDGTGYPEHLKGNDIPLIARIIAVADTFDAMTSDRPYRKAKSDQEAIDELVNNAATQFDGDVVEAFIASYRSGEITKRVD
jgi:HD-GYP domain-containing protein (c-di-GMP phosphodiesterase class II)